MDEALKYTTPATPPAKSDKEGVERRDRRS
jgi:hypothetical protein